MILGSQDVSQDVTGEDCCQPLNSKSCFLLVLSLTSLQNFTGPIVRSSGATVSDDCKSTSSSINFPSFMERTTSLPLVDMSPVGTVKGSLPKPITLVGRASTSYQLAKFTFNLAMKSVITSVKRRGNAFAHC